MKHPYLTYAAVFAFIYGTGLVTYLALTLGR